MNKEIDPNEFDVELIISGRLVEGDQRPYSLKKSFKIAEIDLNDNVGGFLEGNLEYMKLKLIEALEKEKENKEIENG